MNIEITISHEEAVIIYSYLFSDEARGKIFFDEDGKHFMQDLKWPLCFRSATPKPWCFDSAEILWFINLIRNDEAEHHIDKVPKIVKDIQRRFANIYIDMVYSLVPNSRPTHHLDPEKYTSLDEEDEDDHKTCDPTARMQD